MDTRTSTDELKWSWARAWASHEMDTTMQPSEFSGAYTDYEVSDLRVPPPEFSGATNVTQMMEEPHVGNWWSFPTPQAQAQASSTEMREMMYRIAAMQTIHIDPESVKAPKRRNVKISKDPQSVAARHRRERISERIRILQRLVPGGTKMDTASMLDEAIHYLKFLKSQIQSLQRASSNTPPLPLLSSCSNHTSNYLSTHKPFQPPSHNPDYQYYQDA